MVTKANVGADFSVRDKIVIVTGAAAGIGKSIALELGGAGAKVACVDLKEDDVKKVAEQVGSNAVVIKCDVTDEEGQESCRSYACSMEQD
jgi:NAD(P)-dependent dehydrogenase (short-subunit alcohol dehydrogenase family)